MTGFAEPIVARQGATGPDAPLVVLLHGRGSNETDIIGLADHLSNGPAHAAVRAPIASTSSASVSTTAPTSPSRHHPSCSQPSPRPPSRSGSPAP